QIGSDGRYTLKGIPIGSHVGAISAQHSEYQAALIRDLDALHPVEPVADIRLAECVTVEGTIYFAPGKPAAGAKVTEDDSVTANHKSAINDKDGGYRITGVRTAGSAYQQLVLAEAGAEAGGGSPPQWEAATYYEQPVKPGDHITVDLTLKPSLASLQAEWKQK